MSHNSFEIIEGAFVVSDAHYSHIRPDFLYFLKDIDSNKLQPTQLILMGDIFDTLFRQLPYTQQINREAINILNAISLKIEVFYLEGNHDFNLKKIFPKIIVYPLTVQPLSCRYKGKTILLAHGDFGTDLKYKIYTSIIRNPMVLTFLRVIDSMLGGYILKKLDIYLSKKDDCKEFRGFKEFIDKRLNNKFDCDYFIEGHYHQNKIFNFENFIYINLGAFACNQRFFIVKSSQLELLEENIFSKER